MVLYGQVVVGPPASGKTTYCNGMQQYLRLIGRETLVINLDPANEYHHPEEGEEGENKYDNENENTKSQHLPYDTLLDASEDIINLSSVMTELNLGPNGGLVYCMEYMEHHIQDIITLIRERMDGLSNKGNQDGSSVSSPPPYLLFDFPGQVELTTHNTSIQTILQTMTKELDLRLCAVHLVDAISCADVSKFLSAALLSTTTMLRLELPTVNVLSKIDLLGGSSGGSGSGNNTDDDGQNASGGAIGESVPFGLDFFMECQELERLLPFLDGGGAMTSNNYEEEELEWRLLEQDEEYRNAKRRTKSTSFYQKHHRLHAQLCDVIDDYSLLCYVPLDINDAESVGRVVGKIDKSNGYVFTQGAPVIRPSQTSNSEKKNGTGTTTTASDMFQCAMEADGSSSLSAFEYMSNVQERVLTGFHQETIPELENLQQESKR